MFPIRVILSLCLFSILILVKVNSERKVDPTLLYQELLDMFVEIRDGKMLVNDEAMNPNQPYNEGYQGVVNLAKEAHEKYKFKDGLIYINRGDGRHNDTQFDKRIYYTAYNITKSDIYRPQTGPDFSAMSWNSAQLPNFEAEILKIANASKIKPISQKIGWIGNTAMNPIRVHLVEMAREHPDLFDFRHVDAGALNSRSGGYKSIPQLVEEHAYLIDAPGSGYSGRLKFLLHSNRPLFYVERELVEYFNEDLRPNFHYIPIKHDLSNLLHQYQWAIDNPDKAKEIANNALIYAQFHLTHEKFVDKIGEVFTYLLDHQQPQSLVS